MHMRSALLASFSLLVMGVSSVVLAGESYDKEGTEMVLRRAARQVKEHCGQAKDVNGKAVGPWGATKVSVTLGRNGRTKGATVPAPFEGTPTGRCAVQAFAGLTYPPYTSASDVVVDWEVEIPKP